MEQFSGDLLAVLPWKIERSFASVFIYRSMQVGLGWFSAKDLMMTGELQHESNERILKT
ncbi:MAG: hypothetical protein PHW87_06515 [Methanothrix sp.]|nr:hypothetical protein [Methanothrix sp.]